MKKEARGRGEQQARAEPDCSDSVQVPSLTNSADSHTHSPEHVPANLLRDVPTLLHEPNLTSVSQARAAPWPPAPAPKNLIGQGARNVPNLENLTNEMQCDKTSK